MRNAIIFIDIQNDLIDGLLKNYQAMDVAPNFIHYAEKLKQKIMKSEVIEDILFCTQQTHKKTINLLHSQIGYVNTLKAKRNIPEHCVIGTYGWLIYKHFYNAIGGYCTLLQKDTYAYKYWDDYLEDCDTIKICGLYTDTSVLSNAVLIRTIYPEKPISIISNLCVGTTPQKHEYALESMKSLLIDVETVDINVS